MDGWVLGAPDECDLALAGRVVTGSRPAVRGEIRVRDGVIVSVAAGSGSDAPAAERIDVGDAYLLPGAIDCHVHCLSDPGEGVTAATRSAAAGGVTTIIDMPFDADGPIWTVERLRAKRELVGREAHVDVALYGTLRPDGAGATAGELAAAGAACFKLSTFDTDPDRFPRTPPDRFLEVLADAAAAGRRVCVHAENDELIRARLAVLRATGDGRPELHARSRPPVSETAAVAEVLELASAAGARVHLCHLSLPHSVDLARWHAGRGLDVSVETCPHYLVLTEDDLRREGGRCKINPPLRRPADVDALWEQLASGAIDTISSDHAPWPLALKTRSDIFENRSGAPGVETLVPLVVDAALHRREVTVEALAGMLSQRPAKLFGLDHRKGDLRPGLDADITVVDPDARWTIDESLLHSSAGWSPYHGRRGRGKVVLTVSRGEVVWDGEQVLGPPGRGRFLAPADVADAAPPARLRSETAAAERA